jgi:DNA polymerase sigma
VAAIRRLAANLWPASQTILFGSQATGLALPGSDLDIVILGASDELENPASGFSWDQRQALGDRLRALLKAMRKGNLVAGKAVVIKARVPIIKCDLRAGVAADISLGAANGAAAVRFIQKQVCVDFCSSDVCGSA